MTMFFAAYTAPPQDVPGSLVGTNGVPRALWADSNEVALRARQSAATMSMTEGAQLLARMTSHPRARFGAASVLFGTTPLPTALLQVDNHLKAAAPTPEALFWSGQLLRMAPLPAAMSMSAAPTSSAALLYVSAPTAALQTTTVYTLNGAADLKALGYSGLVAANNVDVLRGRTLGPRMYMQQQVPVQNYVGMAVSGAIEAVGGDNVSWLLSDAFGVSGALSDNWVLALADALLFGDVPQFLADAMASLADDFTLSDVATALLRAVLADNVSVSSAPAAWLKLGLQLADAVVLSGQPGVQLDTQIAVALSFALHDTLLGALYGPLSDTLTASGALIATAEQIAALLASFTATATTTSSAILYAFLTDATGLSDTIGVTTQVVQLLADGAQFGMTLYTGQDTYTAWVMTPQSRAMRGYTNYPFNSYAQIGGQLFGAASDGVYELSGDTDAGTSITSSVRSGLLDFNSRQLKRMDAAYIGYAADGTLCMRVSGTSPTGEEVDYLYRMVPKPADAPRETRVKFGRGVKSVYWEFVLDNSADGSDFTLYDVAVLPMLLSRRIS